MYASFWVRAAALVLDSLIIGSITFILSFVAGFSSIVTPGYNSPLEIIVTIINVLISFAYYVGMLWKKGATLGKMAVGIVVLRTDGSSLTLGRAALREIVGKFVSGITLCIGYLVAAFTAKKQGFHDMIADTVVVDLHPEKKKTGWKIFGIVFTIVVPILIIIIMFALVAFVAGLAGKSMFDGLKDGETYGKNQIQILGEIRENAEFYVANNNTLKGYEPETNMSGMDARLEKDVITKISDDGKKAAFYIPTVHGYTDSVLDEVKMLYCIDLDIEDASLSTSEEFAIVEESYLESPTAYKCSK